jgi:hypothetical protein
MKVSDLPAEQRNLRRTRQDYVVIYALVDPRDDSIRYVGKTEKRIAQRLEEHIRFPVNRGTGAWIAELRAAGMFPRIEPITCCGEQWWEGKEAYWIRWLRIRGVRLLNRDPGGVCRFKNGKLNLTGKVKNYIAKRSGRTPSVFDFWKEKKESLKKARRRREMEGRARACGVRLYGREEARELSRALMEREARAVECSRGVDPIIRKSKR